jgi:hypothetical protein
MAMSLAEAAAATGVNRPTLFRAYKSGRMSATPPTRGRSKLIQPSCSASSPGCAAAERTGGYAPARTG